MKNADRNEPPPALPMIVYMCAMPYWPVKKLLFIISGLASYIYSYNNMFLSVNRDLNIMADAPTTASHTFQYNKKMIHLKS